VAYLETVGNRKTKKSWKSIKPAVEISTSLPSASLTLTFNEMPYGQLQPQATVNPYPNQ
jgi:hypothetical protein